MNKKLIYRQRDYQDCGICSLASIIRYYNGQVPLEYLRNESMTNNRGTTAYHLLKTAEKVGFTAEGIKTTKLSSTILLPAIAHLTLPNGLNHFAVIYKVKDNKVVLMDPAVGKKIMALDEFNTLWNNFLIIMHPKRPLLNIVEKNYLLAYLKNEVKQNPKIILNLLFSCIIYIIVSIFLNYYIQIGLNIISFNSQKKIIIFICIFSLLTILKIYSEFTKSYYENYLAKQIDTTIYSKFINHSLSLPLVVTKSRTCGEIMTRFQELKNIKLLITSIYLTLFLDFFMIIITSLFLYNINIQLFKILFIIMFIYTFISYLYNKMFYQKIIANIDEETNMNSLMAECLSKIDSIKNTNTSLFFIEKVKNQVANYLQNNFRLNQLFTKQNFVKNFIIEFGLFLINSFALILIYQEKLELIHFFTFNTFLFYLLEPLKETIETIPKFNYLKTFITKINDYFSNSAENLTPSKEKFVDGDLIIQNLTYSSNKFNNVFKNLNVIIEKGSKVNICGPSGSGKSTICKLIFRLIDPDDGEIKIGGVNISDYHLQTIRQNITYVSQNEHLFSASIIDNLKLDLNYSPNEIAKVLDICELSSVISKQPLRLNSYIIEDAQNFSGGEMQRLILARALLQNKKILILDEALSEVSIIQEKRIIKRIISLYPNKTIIYISHKNVAHLFDKTIRIGEIYR